MTNHGSIGKERSEMQHCFTINVSRGCMANFDFVKRSVRTYWRICSYRHSMRSSLLTRDQSTASRWRSKIVSFFFAEVSMVSFPCTIWTDATKIKTIPTDGLLNTFQWLLTVPSVEQLRQAQDQQSLWLSHRSTGTLRTPGYSQHQILTAIWIFGTLTPSLSLLTSSWWGRFSTLSSMQTVAWSL